MKTHHGSRHSIAVAASHQGSRLARVGWLTLVALVALLAAMFAAVPASAQEATAVRLEVEAGYGGSYRVSQWFPITVIASNDGPDIRGVLEWRYTGNDREAVFQREIDLPRGARKRLTFSALSNNFARVAELRLLVDDRAVSTRRVRIEPIEVERFVVGVISSDETLLNSLSSMEIDTTSGTTVVRMDAELLPENAITLSGVDAIYIHDIATADLGDAQRSALRLWTTLGGQLIVSGGIHADQTVPGLEDILPVTVGDLQSDVSLLPLNTLVPRNRLSSENTAATTVNEVTPLAGASALDSAGLLTAHSLGDGLVIFSAFDLAVLRAWTGEPDLWEHVLEADWRFVPAAAARWNGNNLLRQVLQLSELQLPSFWVLLLFILGYILAIGPVNFLVLRRLKRIDLAWLTIPVLVILFVVATYTASFMIRGFRPLALQITVVQGFEDQEQGKATTFLGVFSPRRNTYTLNFSPDTLVSHERFMMIDTSQTPVVWTDSATRVRNALVDVSSLRTFIVEQTVSTASMGVQVDSTWREEQQQRVGEIENTGTTTLSDAFLVHKNNVLSIGTFQAGDTQTVELSEAQRFFPGQAGAETEGMFNRQTMLDTLFDANRFMSSFGRFPTSGTANDSVLDSEAVYLLGWVEQPAADVQLNNANGEQSGLTLYIVRLDDPDLEN